jgi:hypothetical protein
LRHTAVVLSSNFVSALAVVGVSAVEPGRAEAASTVKSCTGGDVRLSAAEKQMLRLYNKERASRDLPRLCVHPRLQNDRVYRGSRNPSLVKIPHARPYMLRNFKKIVKNTVNGVDIRI